MGLPGERSIKCQPLFVFSEIEKSPSYLGLHIIQIFFKLQMSDATFGLF